MGQLTILIMITFAMVALMTNLKHLLGVLIIVEYMILITFLQSALTMFISSDINNWVIVLLTTSTTGAAIGLSLLIPLTRSHSKDFLSGVNLLW